MAKDIFPLGFHAGSTGHYPADLVHAINERGFRAFAKLIDDDGRAEESLRIGDSHNIENVVVLRISTHRAGQDTESPDQVFAPNKPIEQSADEWWGRHMGEINKMNAARVRNGGQPLDKRVWLELANETNRNTYRQQGEMFAIIAQKYAIPGGWRICAPGSNSGEPESWAGWEDYFRLCALHPEQIAVAIHYYEWRMGDPAHPVVTFDQSTPHLMGREYMIYEMCDALNVDYPTIHVTEGGFKHNMLPGWNPQVADYLDKLARHIGEQPNMTGLGFWCAQRFLNNIHHTFRNDYVPQFINIARNWVAPPQLARSDRPDPIIPGDGSSGGGSNGGGTGTDGQNGSGGESGASAPHKATGSLVGIEARAFGLGHEGHQNNLRVDQSIWFHFEFHNGSDQERPYGGMGVLAWRWLEASSSWQKWQWQNSFGGFNDKLSAGQTLRHGDHINLSETGVFALSLGITADNGARRKLDRPDEIQALQLLREPIYIKVGPHFNNGEVLTTPPAPLEQATGSGDGDGTGSSSGGSDENGGSAGAGTPWTPGRHANIYFLAPTSLTGSERRQLYQLAWEGIELPGGGTTAGRHTVTFSHDDAFDNNVRGAVGSLVVLVEPQRIGTGIDDAWMRANAANVNYLLYQLTAGGVGFGVSGEGDGDASGSGEEAGAGKTDDPEMFAGWIWNNGLTIDDSVTPARVTLGNWLNVRLGPGKDDFPDIQGVLLAGSVVEARGAVERSYLPVRIPRTIMKPPGTREQPKTGIPKPGPGKYVGPKVTFHDGIHGPGDAHTWHNAAFRGMMHNLNMPVKFMSDGDRADRFAEFNRAKLSLVRVFWKPDMSRKKTPRQAWEEDIRDGVKRFYDRGARDFEVHNEPRLHHEGFAHQWHDGSEFGDFLQGLMRIIKAECPEARLWYPGESPGVPWTDQFVVTRPAFRKVASLLSGICMHAYTGTTNDAEAAANEIVGQVREYRTALYDSGLNPEAWQLPIIVSECSVNRAPANAGDAFAAYRADVYKRTASKLSKIPGVKGVFWYTSHWNPPPNEQANKESWFGTSLPDKYKQAMGR